MKKKPTKFKELSELKLIDYETKYESDVQEVFKYMKLNLSEDDFNKYGDELENKVFMGEILNISDLKKEIVKLSQIGEKNE